MLWQLLHHSDNHGNSLKKKFFEKDDFSATRKLYLITSIMAIETVVLRFQKCLYVKGPGYRIDDGMLDRE